MIHNAKCIKDNLWLSPQQPFSKRPDGTQILNIYIRNEDGTMAALEMLSLSPDGTLSSGGKTIGNIDSPEFTEYLKKFQFAPDLVALTGRAPPESEEELFKLISDVYKQTKSIKKTAKMVQVSEEKTRRILFTTGDYTCETHEKIMAQLKEGVSLEKIASDMGLSRNNVRVYLPY